MILATCLPICIAAGETPGTGLPSASSTSAMSPMAKISGCCGRLKSGFTFTRPALSSSTPSCWVSGVAETPAAQRIVPARMISPVTSSTSPARMAFTCSAVRTCTPSFSSWRCALADKSGGKCASTRGEPSMRMMRACVGSMCRKSPAKTVRASSAKAPASSTPVGPPPTMTMVKSRSCSVMSGSVSAFFKREQNITANAERVVERFEAGRKLFPFGMAEIAGLAAEREHKVVVVERRFFEENFFLRQIKTGDGFHQNGDVRTVGENGTNRLGDVRRGKSGGGDLIKQRLKEVMVRAVNERDARIRRLKSPAEGQSAKTRAQHDDMFFVRHVNNLK